MLWCVERKYTLLTELGTLYYCQECVPSHTYVLSVKVDTRFGTKLRQTYLISGTFYTPHNIREH